MKTITAKELRDNLGKITRRVRMGEQIRVTYRSNTAFIITPEKNSVGVENPGGKGAMLRFINLAEEAKQGAKMSQRLRTEPDLMKIYWEDMAKKYDIEN